VACARLLMLSGSRSDSANRAPAFRILLFIMLLLSLKLMTGWERAVGTTPPFGHPSEGGELSLADSRSILRQSSF